MPENGFTSRNNGRDEDAAQNHKHLNEMTPDELTDALADMWDAMDETNYDPAQIDAYLTELEKREQIVPDFDSDTSLATFREKHTRLFDQTSPVQISTTEKPAHHRRWRASLVAAIIVVMMLCSMITAQAFGFDVFGAIARWTAETFHFSTFTQSDENQQNVTASTEGEFSTLQEALDAYGVALPVAIQWYPEGFEVKEITVTPQEGVLKILASYQMGEENISVTIRQYDKPENMDNGTFEKDATDVLLYEHGGITYYIMSNIGRLTATWIAGKSIICSISGDLTMDQIKEMINSIYEG